MTNLTNKKPRRKICISILRNVLRAIVLLIALIAFCLLIGEPEQGMAFLRCIAIKLGAVIVLYVIYRIAESDSVIINELKED